jgi:hypothetical protein
MLPTSPAPPRNTARKRLRACVSCGARTCFVWGEVQQSSPDGAEHEPKLPKEEELSDALRQPRPALLQLHIIGVEVARVGSQLASLDGRLTKVGRSTSVRRRVRRTHNEHCATAHAAQHHLGSVGGGVPDAAAHWQNKKGRARTRPGKNVAVSCRARTLRASSSLVSASLATTDPWRALRCGGLFIFLSSFDFSHISRQLIMAHVSKGLYCWEVGNGQELQGWPIHPPAFSPNASPCSVEHLQNQGNMVRGSESALRIYEDSGEHG